MSQDVVVSDVQSEPAAGISSPESRRLPGSSVVPARMQYRSRPVSVSVDPVSLVISECISITSAIHKHARSPHSSVSAILGGSPTPVQVGPPSPALPGRKSIATTLGGDSAGDPNLTNRWGLRGKRGKSIQDNPLMAGFGRLRHELATVRGESDIPIDLGSAAATPVGSIALTQNCRHPRFRCPYSFAPVPPDCSNERHCRPDHHSDPRRSPKVPGLRLHLPNLSSVPVGYAVPGCCRDEVPI